MSNFQINYESKGYPPSSKILIILDQLSKDKNNTIFIITGREGHLVSEWFSSVPDLGLASEHGFLFKYNSNNDNGTWSHMIKGFNSSWRSRCVEHLEPYTERCEGSYIEVKESSVVWQYSECDPELGKSFANVITLDLENCLINLNLKIVNGKGYVEVKPRGVNKGAFVAFILKEEIKKNKIPDFLLAIGDDTSDEEIFKFLSKKKFFIKKYSRVFIFLIF